MTAAVPLVLVSQSLNGHAQAKPTPAGVGPRQDYVEIARSLGGEVKGSDLVAWPALGSLLFRLERRIKLSLIGPCFALRRRARYNLLLSTSEKTAIPLAAMCAVTGHPMPHVVIAHKLSSGLKAPLFKIWPLHNSFSHIICVSQTQADYAVTEMGLPPGRVHFIPDKVDHHFFAPTPVPEEAFVLAVGREQRDYAALVQALAGTGIRLVIAATSPWSTGRVQIPPAGNVTLLRQTSYPALRHLYAQARLVVVPLREVDYAAGVNAVLEAMAMAKPLVVTRSPGLAGYVVDGETGCIAPAGDATALRHQILTLWHAPQERKRLGANAHQAVAGSMNLDVYVDRVRAIAQAALAPS